MAVGPGAGRGAAALAHRHVGHRGQLLRRRHHRRRGARLSVGRAALRADRRNGRALSRPPGAVVGDAAAHLLRRLDASGCRRRADSGALGGARRGARALGAGLVAWAPAAERVPAPPRSPAAKGPAGRPARRSTSSSPRCCSAGPSTASTSARFDDQPWLAPLIVAVPYLLAGYLRPRPAFAAGRRRGAGSGRDGALERRVRRSGRCSRSRCSGPSLDLRLGRTDGRWYGLLTLAAALQQLFDGAAGARGAADRAFVGPWALGALGQHRRHRRATPPGSGEWRAVGRTPGSSARGSGSSPVRWRCSASRASFGATSSSRASAPRRRISPRGWR